MFTVENVHELFSDAFQDSTQNQNQASLGSVRSPVITIFELLLRHSSTIDCSLSKSTFLTQFGGQYTAMAIHFTFCRVISLTIISRSFVSVSVSLLFGTSERIYVNTPTMLVSVPSIHSKVWHRTLRIRKLIVNFRLCCCRIL